ncbi:MFS transporter [Paenibacillus sp. CAA11]|uniref:MFS transporter n=1 Tax=Paenibacillus sp. CAA11 TaxID=1532905 RepID=UPI000D374EA3|nr:MFS transporter [Paenibacillus sp. CAA11]AWB45487.1 MFS transporter [Paenibacillus sp. CAA11]
MRLNVRAVVQYVICLGAFLSNLSAGMFNIALVDIANEFGASISSAQWIVTIYLLVISVSLPLMGRLGDRFGKRRIHNLGYFIFMLGALASALAPALSLLIPFRILQGIGASMYQATNMALIVAVFPKEQRGRALGLISTFVAAGSMVGPSLGGFLIQWFSWRANFWLLTVLTAAAWLLAQRYIPEDHSGGGGRVDLAGAAMFAAALTGLITAVNLGSAWGWESIQVMLLLLLFALGTVSFVVWCLSPHWSGKRSEGREPFIQLSLFGDAGVMTGIFITIVTYMSAFASQLVLPVFLRSELGMTAAQAGLMMMGYPLALIIVAPLSGSWSDKQGPLPLLGAGLAAMIGSVVTLGFMTPSFPVTVIILLVILLGASMGMITSPNNSLVMDRVEKPSLGLISSLLALSRNLGMMLGTAVGGALVTLPVSTAGNSTASGTAGIHQVFAVCSILLICGLATLVLMVRVGKRKRVAESPLQQ